MYRLNRNKTTSMRYFTLLTAFCLLLGTTVRPALAQQTDLVVSGQLTWKGYAQALKASGQLQQVPTFAGSAFLPGEEAGRYLVRISGRVAEGQIRNAVYAPFSATDAKLFDLANLAKAPAVVLSGGIEKHQPVTLAAVLSVRRSPQSGQPEKLISFEYAYSLSAAPQVAARGIKSRPHSPTSVLKQGQWFKIGVPENGIYKIDKNTLRAIGVNVQGLDPRRLQLFGNAMGTLPQRNNAYRPDDLVENAVYVAGEGDGSFDDNDYLLFYARGPHTWSSDASTRLFRHTLNAFTDTAYYFVRVGSAPGRRVAAAPGAGTPTASISQYAYHNYYERDLVNLIKSGRQWMGEGFTSGAGAKEFAFATPDLVPSSNLQVTSYTAARSAVGITTRFDLTLNGNPLGSQNIDGISALTQLYPEAANGSLRTFSTALPPAPAATTRVGLSYAGGSDPAAQGWLDYVEINAQRQLRLIGSQVDFRSFENIAPGATSQFVLNTPGATVWEVTNPRRPRSYTVDGGNFRAVTDSLREFVAFTGSNFPAPIGFGAVGNQNLHELNLDGRLDMVIVTYPPFFAEAERLANWRRTNDNLNVRVVTTTQVYNEFSSGGQDVTAIRDLMKMVYDRTPAGKTVFLLLFGDASYDYKSDLANNPDRLPDWWKTRSPLNGDKINQNFVPTYQSRESFSVAYDRPNSNPVGTGPSYNSDDYFGLLDDREGYWNESIYYSRDSTELLDIGIGRLPIRTPRDKPASTAQAAAVVNKLIRYDQPVGFGKWRNRITFVADDGDRNYHLTTSTDPPAERLTQLHPEFNAHKVYLDLYPQVIAAGGQRSPECNRAIDESIEQGSLIVQYSGHGGTKGWADEQIMTNASVLNLQNRDRLTFLLTATCDFSTFDNPEFDSAGEQALTDTNGGAVGLLTTTRLAFTGSNDDLVNAFYASAFEPINGKKPRMGDILQATKNGSISGVLNRNFVLLGDPSMRLAYPDQQVTLDSINGRLLTATNSDTLKALSTVTMSGKVRTGGAVNSSFNGKAQLTIYEKPAVVSTLGNEDAPVQVTVQENVIYAGQATVRNGNFRLRFVVPKDINYSFGLGKVSLYASDSVRRVDGHGARLVPVGGANILALTDRDTLAPTIRLFLDDTTFVFGGLTGTTTTLLARLKDKSGINTAGSGIGHEITATLDNDPSKLTVLNEFYTANVDNFQQGQVKYLFKDLPTGPHILRLKAWDTYNNSAEKDLEFIAASSQKLALEHVLNYPNPFSTTTTFHFDHNRADDGDELDVQVQIFTISGKLVRTLRATALGSDPHFKALSWNGRDEFDDQLARGVYVYRVSVKSQQTGTMASKFEKLVILN
ncbi:type IX secretion system sortase PorU [Hymenobacter algoricola]|uniref:Type IX secretion system sortase PorU n=1 Tax=Hymenobacter algoricola TaxID=486267 RepID=A0ABP7N2Q4_9BACT